MRYMMMVKADRESEAGQPPSPELMAAIGGLTEEMMRAGVLLETGGLARSAEGVRIHAEGGALSVVDGPFSESKELIGGYAVLNAASRDEAIEHGRRFMQLHLDVLGPSWSGQLEIRRLCGPGEPEAC